MHRVVPRGYAPGQPGAAPALPTALGFLGDLPQTGSSAISSRAWRRAGRFRAKAVEASLLASGVPGGEAQLPTPSPTRTSLLPTQASPAELTVGSEPSARAWQCLCHHGWA